MKPRMPPDWFAPVFAWSITLLVWLTAATKPDGVYLNRKLIGLPPLLAIAWTFGCLGMMRLRKKFAAEHAALGSPQLFGSPHEGRHWRFVGYLFRFRFLQLGDAVISISFSIFVGFTILGLIWFLGLIYWE